MSKVPPLPKPDKTRLQVLLKNGLKLLLMSGFLVGLVLTVWVLFSPLWRPVIIYPYEPAMLHVDEKRHDLGDIKTDSKASDTFYLYNLGGKRLDIKNVSTSCGCTVATLSRKILVPGQVAVLKVVLDTSIKLGKVRKTITIFSNDPHHPVEKLYLKANVLAQMQGHAKIRVKDPLVLFKGQCATCHVNVGKGKMGKDLFLADCAMCHGANGQGAVAMSLLNRDYDNELQRGQVREIIAAGSRRSPEMPPYAIAHGGPLTDSEIDSLVNFLVYEHAQSKAGLLDPNMPEDAEEEQ